MPSQAFEARFVAYIHVVSLSILLWDLMNNVKNECRLLFRHRLGFPLIVYFLSRISVLGFALVSTIFMTTPFVACTAFEATFVVFFITGLASTMFLSYLRVCGVWHWSPVIVGLFGASWISVVASGFAVINSIKGVEVENNYCEEILVGQRVLAPIITTFFNHTIVFLAIAFGVCKNTIGKDLSLGDCLRLMFGRRLRTFTNALLHDSQVCYIITMGIAVVTIVWFFVWMGIEPSSAFRIALTPPYVVLVNILICRVFRNTKLGLYSKVSALQSNDYTSETHTAAPNSSTSWKFRREATDVTAASVTPIQISVNQVVECKTDYPPMINLKRPAEILDFGMV
jgi:hypothetical protein